MDRDRLWKVLHERCRDPGDKHLLSLMIELYGQSRIVLGEHGFEAERGVVQGAVMSPMLFNVYLDAALNTSAKLR